MRAAAKQALAESATKAANAEVSSMWPAVGLSRGGEGHRRAAARRPSAHARRCRPITPHRPLLPLGPRAQKTWVSTVKDAAAKADAAMADVTAKEKAANDDAANAAKAVLEKFKAEINKIMLGGGGGSSAGGGKGRAT